MVSLVASIRQPVNDELVRVLGDLLERAKSGELQTLIGIGNLNDGGTTHVCSTTKDCDLVRILGHCSRLERKLNLLIDARAVESEY